MEYSRDVTHIWGGFSRGEMAERILDPFLMVPDPVLGVTIPWNIICGLGLGVSSGTSSFCILLCLYLPRDRKECSSITLLVYFHPSCPGIRIPFSLKV